MKQKIKNNVIIVNTKILNIVMLVKNVNFRGVRGMRTEEEKLEEIKDIAQGMYDWWVNKTQYTDVYELAEHLLGTELKRILWVLEEQENE